MPSTWFMNKTSCVVTCIVGVLLLLASQDSAVRPEKAKQLHAAIAGMTDAVSLKSGQQQLSKGFKAGQMVLINGIDRFELMDNGTKQADSSSFCGKIEADECTDHEPCTDTTIYQVQCTDYEKCIDNVELTVGQPVIVKRACEAKAEAKAAACAPEAVACEDEATAEAAEAECAAEAKKCDVCLAARITKKMKDWPADLASWRPVQGRPEESLVDPLYMIAFDSDDLAESCREERKECLEGTVWSDEMVAGGASLWQEADSLLWAVKRSALVPPRYQAAFPVFTVESKLVQYTPYKEQERKQELPFGCDGEHERPCIQGWDEPLKPLIPPTDACSKHLSSKITSSEQFCCCLDPDATICLAYHCMVRLELDAPDGAKSWALVELGGAEGKCEQFAVVSCNIIATGDKPEPENMLDFTSTCPGHNAEGEPASAPFAYGAGGVGGLGVSITGWFSEKKSGRSATQDEQVKGTLDELFAWVKNDYLSEHPTYDFLGDNCQAFSSEVMNFLKAEGNKLEYRPYQNAGLAKTALNVICKGWAEGHPDPNAYNKRWIAGRWKHRRCLAIFKGMPLTDR